MYLLHPNMISGTGDISATALAMSNAVTLFCWNELNSDNAEKIATDILGSAWAYKFREVVECYDSRSWGTQLLYLLPTEQAMLFMAYCYKKYYEQILKRI